MVNRKTLSVCIGILCMGAGMSVLAQDISVSGSWSVTIDESSLVGGVTGDLPDTYTSDANQALINITHASYGWFGTWYWRVDVHRVDSNWDSHLLLDVLRSGSGIGFGSIAGGTSFQEIRTSPRTLLSGSRHRIWIGLQYQLRGVSLEVPPATYGTTVVFTVVEQ